MLLAAVFFMFVGPVLNIFGNLYLNSTHLYLVAVLAFAFFIRAMREAKVGLDYGLVFSLWLVAFCYILLVTMFVADYSALFDFLFMLCAISASFMLAKLFVTYRPNDFLEVFFRFCFYCCIIWAVTIFLSYVFPSFRAWMDLLFFRDDSRGEHLVMLRVPAFHPMGGDGASLNFSLLILIASGYLWFLSGLQRFLVACALVVCLLTSLLSARSGFIICVPLLFASYLLAFRGHLVTKVMGTTLVLVVLMFSYIWMSPSFESYMYSSVADNGYEHPISRALITLNQFSRGGASATTVGTLRQMIIFPDDTADLVFGSGEFSRYLRSSFDRGGSDIGYIILLNGAGIIGSIFTYLIFIAPVFALFFARSRFIKKNAIAGDNRVVALLVLMMIFSFVGHFKTMYILTGYFNLMYFTSFFVFMSFLKNVNLNRARMGADNDVAYC